MSPSFSPGSGTLPALLKPALARAIKQRPVLIVGPDALTVRWRDSAKPQTPQPFYRLVAQRLLSMVDESYADDALAFESWNLYRAVEELICVRKVMEEQDLALALVEILADLKRQVAPAGALEALARLNCFDLIVCLTPDDLLQDALRAAQPELELCVSSYTPGTEGGQEVDIPPEAPGRLRLHHPFGRAEIASDFAIHAENTLECLYQLQDRDKSRVRNLLTTLRTKHLFFLGAGLPDWLGRNLMRFLSTQRLRGNDNTMEYFCTPVEDPGLKSFIERFSKNSRMLDLDAESFVREISALAPATQPPVTAPTVAPGALVSATVVATAHANPTAMAPLAGLPPRLGNGPTAFVSYSSEDGEAAAKLARSLLDIGFGDVWFDKNKLGWGDDWSDSIDRAIQHCDYFVPIISANAERRASGNGGVYILEWRNAVARSRLMTRKFMLPVGVDPQAPVATLYPHICVGELQAFWAKQLLHAPGGQLSDQQLTLLGSIARATLGVTHA